MTLQDTTSITSLPGWEFGPSPCAALGGRTVGEFGRALAPANLSAALASSLGLMTSGIYGPHGSTSLRSSRLAASLANRLTARCRGSTLYKLTLKPRVTPLQRQIFALRASAARTFANGYSLRGWATPSTRDWKDTPGMATGATNPDGSHRKRTDQLPRQVYSMVQNGATVGAASPDLFNPAFALWLLRIPPVWDACAPTVTPLTLKPPRNSAGQ